jgi:hypothetical protein
MQPFESAASRSLECQARLVGDGGQAVADDLEADRIEPTRAG